MSKQPIPARWSDDEPDDVPRHAAWLIHLADGTWHRIGAWPALTRDEVLAAYRCLDAVAD